MTFTKKLSTLLIGTALLIATGCNTIEGIGEDLGAAGNAIDRAASENKGY